VFFVFVGSGALKFFPPLIKKGKVFGAGGGGGGVFENKVYVLIFSTTFVWNFCHSGKN